MPITFLNGTPSGSNSVSFDTKFLPGVYFLINYTKGNESQVDLTFQTFNELHPSAAQLPASASFFDVVSIATNGIVSTYKVSLNATGNYSIPLDSPASSDLMMLNIAYVGGTTGTLKVFIAPDDRYA